MLLCWRFSILFFSPSLASLAFSLLHKTPTLLSLYQRPIGLNDTYNDWQPAYIEKKYLWSKNLNKLTAFLYMPADSLPVMFLGCAVCQVQQLSLDCLLPCSFSTNILTLLPLVFMSLLPSIFSIFCLKPLNRIFRLGLISIAWSFFFLKSQRSALSQLTKSFFVFVHFHG